MDTRARRWVLGELARLADRRPVFHSEADFQHAFAWQVHLDVPESDVRLEVRPAGAVNERIDVLLVLAGVRLGIELKYLTRSLDVTVAGERFVLKTHSAQDQRRYDVVADIARLERWAHAGLIDEGVAVVVSNDPGYWNPQRSVAPVDAAFRLTEGRTLTGEAMWAGASAGTMAGRTRPLTLTGSYPLAWTAFSDLGCGAPGVFRCVAVGITQAGDTAPTAASGAWPL